MATAPEPATPRRKPGRPTKLTPELQAAILTEIQATGFTRRAARAVRVSKTSVYSWAAQGAEPGAREELRAFSLDFARARANAARNHVIREPITDGAGREIGIRVTRRLRNGRTDVTEQYVHPGHRAIRRRLRASRRDELAAVLRLDGAA